MIQIYHGSREIVKFPEIRTHKFYKDFYWGFYCTKSETQARRWAGRHGNGVVNIYRYTPDAALRVRLFSEATEEWLDFIAACRTGKAHLYDIVEGPMADDVIFNYVQSFIDGEISREAFWALVKFKHPTHQISFHTARALRTLRFERSYGVDEEKKR